MSRRKLIAANWKMNGDKSLCDSMLAALDDNANLMANVDVLICPPYTFLNYLSTPNKVTVGAQNTSQHEYGAFTGETSVSMLKDVGCEYAIVGHSERREVFSETDIVVAEKFIRNARSGLKPILCVGESQSARETGITELVLKTQLESVISVSKPSDWEGAVIAYEPIWAVGTGNPATPEVAQETHAYIRKLLRENEVTKHVADSLRILYGGSMKPENAGKLLAQEDIDGGLIGGAALNPESFIAILSLA